MPSTIGHVNPVTNVPAPEWASWVQDNQAVVLDVREPSEWNLGTLPDAMLISQGQLLDRLEELPKDRPILCVCQTGFRSSTVAAFLAFNDYQTANLAGGMKALGMQA